ncbi:MAG TPA: ABC transporter permease [Pseudonocardiaceae bacterium]|nr:ABC transporter permease [Pseudonocardiaceae bacterium]
MTAIRATSPSHTWAAIGLQARLVANETTKGAKLLWRRRGRLIATLVSYLLTYLGFSLLVGGGHLVRPLMVLTVPGLLAYVVAGTAALQGSGGIAEEANSGTLEQTQLSPAAQSVHILGRLAALAMEGLLVAAVLGTLLISVFRLSYQPNPAVLIPAVLTVVSALGYGLLMTALTVRVLSIGAVIHITNALILFFGGTVLPVSVFPGPGHIVARFFPTTLGVEATRTLLSGKPLSATWVDGTLPWLIVHTIVLLALGWVLYIAVIRRARRQGGLGPR